MKFNKFIVVIILMIFLSLGVVNAADNVTQNDAVLNSSDSSNILKSANFNDYLTLQDNITQDGNLRNTDSSQEISYDNRYYLFRGDLWTVNHNFESSAAVTSETYSDLTVTGTFRTQNDIVGLYWNSQDSIQHPYISYGNRSDYSDVILEFDYEMEGCRDFSNSAVNIIIAENSGETYYLPMNQFIENNHLTLDFNNLTLTAGSFYSDKNGQSVKVDKQSKLDVTNLKYVMLLILPVDFCENNSQYTITENTDFKCIISNITVINGEISLEQFPLEAHQYKLCEGYDDVYNLNPFRLTKEMRKLGYADWVDLYIGASYFYEKSGIAGDVIDDLEFNHNRSEKMILNKDVPLNAAFKSWLDCYSRELKNNGINNIIISVSMENLQCPQSWRQTDSNGNFAMTGWQPSTFLYSPCNDEVISYMQKVSEACLDIVVKNAQKPILQMGETWWWWTESGLSNQSPFFYDNQTRYKFLDEHGYELPVYTDIWTSEYDVNAIEWLNHQLVEYSDALREVVKAEKYDNGLYLALFFPPSVIDSDRVPSMMRDANYIKGAYSPDKLDILQIEDYDWVILESPHHSEAYSIGKELGFGEDRLHYFGGFVQDPNDADKYWKLITESMDEALEKKFSEVFVWAGSQVRRDSKIIGFDEDYIFNNLSPTTLTSPDFASVGENFTIAVNTNKWVNGVFNIYEYNEGKKGEMLASSNLAEGFSAISLSRNEVGLNRFYMEFNCSGGQYHLIEDVYIVENSLDVTAEVSGEIETGLDLNITFYASKNSSAQLHISLDGNSPESYHVENGEFKTAISDLPAGYHTVSLKYNSGKYIGGKLTGEVYSNTFIVNVGSKTFIEVDDFITTYNSNEKLVLNLKDSKGNALSKKEILVQLEGSNHTVTTDENGQAILAIDLPVGNYSAEMLFEGEEGYLSSSSNVNVTVGKAVTHLTTNTVTVDYGNKANLIITVKDDFNNFLKGQYVIVKLNNVIYNRSTDSNGQIKLSLSLSAKSYTAKITFAGDDNYKSSSQTAKVVVKKATPKITAKAKSFKRSVKTKKYTITLKTNKNKVMKYAKVTIKINKKTYSAKTNKKGQATFKITKLTKKGKYTAVVKYSGNSNYNSISKKIKITIK